MDISRSALDNYITGNWGEDQFNQNDDTANDRLAELEEIAGGPVECSNCDARATETQDGKPFCEDCGIAYEKAGAYLGDEEQDPMVSLRLIDDDYWAEDRGLSDLAFADPGGNSALRAESATNPRNLPCPTCGEPNRLTPADKALHYQCDSCADQAERGGF